MKAFNDFRGLEIKFEGFGVGIISNEFDDKSLADGYLLVALKQEIIDVSLRSLTLMN